MHTPELKVTVSLVSVVKLVGIGDFGQERARVLGQRMEEYSVHNEGESL